MSQQSSRDGYQYPPYTHSLQPRPEPDAHVSSSNALSHQPGNLYATSASNPVLANRLIPRDYLSSRTRTVPVVDAPNSRSSPLASDPSSTSFARPESAAAVPPTDTPDGSTLPARYNSSTIRSKVGVATEPESLDTDEDLDLTRTQSPDSVDTSTTLDSTALSSKPVASSSFRSIHNNMPRTSSIDSAISSVSASSAHQKGHGDTRDPSPSSIRGLIATAGSAENLVSHLLREKNHAASQNNQLWKLVEKQRALLLGLNKDLERVTKDRDRYKKKLKEVQSNGALPRAATQSPSRELLHDDGSKAVKPPTMPHRDELSQQSTLTSSPREGHSPISVSVLPQVTKLEATPEPNFDSIQPALRTPTARPVLAVTAATPPSEKSAKSPPLRKAPPKPLNLAQSNLDASPQNSPQLVDRNTLSNGDEEQSRGRRKTREDDDRDREKSLMKEQEARSKSKKQSQNPAGSQEQKAEPVVAPAPAPAPIVLLPSSPRPQGLAPSSAFAAMQGGVIQENSIALPLRSPGLPASPRPMNLNIAGVGSLPMSPRAAPTPLSPRAPKQPIPPPMMSPSPFADPALIQRQNAMARAVAAQNAQNAQNSPSNQQPDRLQVHDPTPSNDVPAPYQGLVSASYPQLLLPPNALPSILVKVASSRLRPSRHSMLGLRTQEDSTVFSLSIYSRASRNELWRIEKIPAALAQLEQQLRPRCNDLPKLPDRKLFSGHSPAIIDARRQALDVYFEEVLDMEIDESCALIICRFLSEDVLDPTKETPRQPGVNQDSLPQNTSLNGKVVKTGFLTKRGKNFGGWKSRYFVLDSPELKYYETPGGPQIGAIRLVYARIGSQKTEDSIGNDQDDQYRHAFLIQEPKKKDSNTFVRHVLCAESDADRDEWVAALLHYVDEGLQRETSHSPKIAVFPPSVTGRGAIQHNSSTKDRSHRTLDTHSNSPSPTSPASMTDSIVTDVPSKNGISGPVNGKPIADLNEWNNRATTQQALKDKNSRVPNIFRKQQEAGNKARNTKNQGYVRAVFGLPLSDAVEYCSPSNMEVRLPAVVYRSIEYLRYRKASNEEGLFRLSGSNIVVKTLKERFNTEGDIDLTADEEYYDVHAVASLFKQYLRELPSPLLTRDLHLEFLKVLELESQAEKVGAFNILVHQLPEVNFQLVRAMSEYLLEVTENSGKNKMSIRNMGIVFSPTVNIPTPVFTLFLAEFDAIFEQDPRKRTEQARTQRTEVEVPSGLSPVDIRSPRHQMFSDIPTPAYNESSFADKMSNHAPSKGHQATAPAEFGFTPLHPSYESGQYVTMPGEVPRTQAVAPPPQMHDQQPEYNEEQFSSLNGLMVTNNGTTDKRRKRESAMLF